MYPRCVCGTNVLCRQHWQVISVCVCVCVCIHYRQPPMPLPLIGPLLSKDFPSSCYAHHPVSFSRIPAQCRLLNLLGLGTAGSGRQWWRVQ